MLYIVIGRVWLKRRHGKSLSAVSSILGSFGLPSVTTNGQLGSDQLWEWVVDTQTHIYTSLSPSSLLSSYIETSMTHPGTLPHWLAPCSHTHTHTRTHARTHACTHTHTHTQHTLTWSFCCGHASMNIWFLSPRKWPGLHAEYGIHNI